jgi:hypothetical protein
MHGKSACRGLIKVLEALNWVAVDELRQISKCYQLVFHRDLLDLMTSCVPYLDLGVTTASQNFHGGVCCTVGYLPSFAVTNAV